MKRLLFLCAMIMAAHASIAQPIRIKKIKKIPVERHVYFASFGNKSHEIILSGQDRQAISFYNTRNRREKPISELKDALPVPGSAGDAPVHARGNGKKIELIMADSTHATIAPAGECFYIWVSVSPDGKRLLFTAAGKGSYVSDLEGQIISELGYLNAPAWVNDNWVVGMNDLDDGHQVTSSDVIAVSIPAGNRQNLTLDLEEIALDPSVSVAADRIAFHNLKGEVFIMKIRIRD